METNFYGPLFLTRAFVPVLAAKNASVLNKMNCVLSWYAVFGAHSASQSALWSATNSLSLELAPKGVHVVGVHVGYVGTPMAAHVTEPKMLPEDLVQAVYDAVEASSYEVLADAVSVQVKAGLSAPSEALYSQLGGARAE